MDVLVTGGAGYVGSMVVPLLLAQDHRVRVVDSLMHGGQPLLGVWSHPRFEFRRCDIRDRNAMRAALEGIEAVVHLAAIVGDPACKRRPDEARAVNLDASLALLGDSRQAGVNRFVFASTCSNYGKMADANQYVDETSELHPVSLYAETKVAMEGAVLDPAHTGQLCATSLRCATVFGVSPRMRFDLTVNGFTMELLTKKQLVVFGERFWRPYVHVRDVARAILLVLGAPEATVRNQVFNAGATDQNYQKQHLVEMIRPFVPDAVLEYVDVQEDPRDYRVSFAKIGKLLGFAITRTVQEGIAEVAHLVKSGVIADYADPRYRN
jgi:nucleoside-diphosphate-sugar epimerase